MSLLVYSPLSSGVLTGKYLSGKYPKGSRFDYNKRNDARYNPAHAQKAIQAYVDLAGEHDLDPAELALAFVNSREFVTGNILGATSLAQLKVDIGSIDVELSDDVLSEVERLHSQMPSPLT